MYRDWVFSEREEIHKTIHCYSFYDCKFRQSSDIQFFGVSGTIEFIRCTFDRGAKIQLVKGSHVFIKACGFQSNEEVMIGEKLSIQFIRSHVGQHLDFVSLSSLAYLSVTDGFDITEPIVLPKSCRCVVYYKNRKYRRKSVQHIINALWRYPNLVLDKAPRGELEFVNTCPYRKEVAIITVLLSSNLLPNELVRYCYGFLKMSQT